MFDLHEQFRALVVCSGEGLKLQLFLYIAVKEDIFPNVNLLLRPDNEKILCVPGRKLRMKLVILSMED